MELNSQNSMELKKLITSLVIEHNILRTDPQNYITYLEEYIKYIHKDNILSVPGQKPIKLREGVESFHNAIDFLKIQKPVNSLTFNTLLSQSAQEFAEYLGSNGIISQIDNNGLNVGERIENLCEWHNICSENVDYGSKTARDVIISLLVDDGLKTKNHRSILFNEKLNYFGIGISEHLTYERVVVIDYVGGIRNKGESYFTLDDFSKNSFDSENKTNISMIDQSCVKSVKVFESLPKDVYKGQVRKVRKIIYELNDGRQHIIEVENYIN